MQMPKPVLVLVEYSDDRKKLKQSESGPPSEYSAPITRFVELDPALCDPPCELEGDKSWTIFTHLRVEGEKEYARLALKLPAPAPEYRITVSPDLTGAGEEELLRYPAGEWVYFYIPTKFQRDGKVLPSAYENAVSAGKQFIHISCGDQVLEPIFLRICPSSLTEQEYAFLLQDIALLQRQLLMGKTKKATVSVGQRWEEAALDVEKQTAQMKAILRRLETAPERELVSECFRLPYHKIKRLTPKTLVDQASGKRLLRTEVHKDSFNIYEHRMIRTYLENLKKLAGQYRVREQEERKLQVEEQISQQERDDAENQIKKYLDRLFRPVKLQFESMDNRFHLWVCEETHPQWEARKNDYGRLHILPFLGPDRAAPLRTDCCRISRFSMNIRSNGRQALFFWLCIEELRKHWEREKCPFQVSFSGKFFASDPRSGPFWVDVMDLESMEVQGGRLYRLQDYFSGQETWGELLGYMKRFPADMIPDSKDELFYSIALLDQAEFQQKLLAEEEQNPDRWEAVERHIDQLLKGSPLLCGAGSGERLHTSNLFAMHPNYRRAYKLMRETEQQFVGIELWETRSSIRVDHTEKLYELWCLLKMLSIWINDYSFELISHDRKRLTDQILRYLRSGKENLGVETLVLRNTLRKWTKNPQETEQVIELRLDYDKKQWIQEGGRRTYLQPDFYLEILYPDSKEGIYRFCLDAKYHNYADKQMTKWGWYRNMFEVALDKYIFRLGQGADTKIHGSYILHSDSRNPNKNIDRYFWSGYVREENSPDMFQREKHDVEGYLARKVSGQKEQEILDRLPGELDMAADCQFGAVCFTPLNDAPFRGLMQMIMEHFLGLYKEKCWICGSDAPAFDTLRTETDFEKYYITCPNCREFWVESHCFSKRCKNRPLGKHRHNYYRTSDSIWNVICPDCRSRFRRTPPAAGMPDV